MLRNPMTRKLYPYHSPPMLTTVCLSRLLLLGTLDYLCHEDANTPSSSDEHEQLHQLDIRHALEAKASGSNVCFSSAFDALNLSMQHDGAQCSP